MLLDDEIVANYVTSRGAYFASKFDPEMLLTAERYYRKNRAEHGVELFYEVDLPAHIKFVHPLGAVLGRATYGDYLVVYQNVGVGSDLDGNRPTIGEGVVLFPGAKVLGKTKIGNNVFITANTVVQDVEVPDNTVVFMGTCYDQREGSINIVPVHRGTWTRTHRSVKEHYFPNVKSGAG